MASSSEFVEYVCNQLQSAGIITYKKMFGEYGLYCNGIFFATVCDDQLFIKITNQGLTLMQDAETAAPYPGAKPCFLIADLENAQVLHQLTNLTCNALVGQKSKKYPKKTHIMNFPHRVGEF
ncbi:TfoX/Sxy family protein [uncultured Sphaerochaeta sp.]|uniref:TfoX/Sxy family protein n=1 Tax=uncultured Sphaerochaeta sp. TaxID=886478 RepID=UPI002A0A99F7|nr:TfoX/Sxy family protein [uncultured Sphaerochaeta sp.]